MAHMKFIKAIWLACSVLGPGLLCSQTDKFISFEVKPGTGNTVIVEWRFRAEADTLPFEVERTRNQVIWERIAVVQPQVHHYISIDTYPGEGLVYYRVRQADPEKKLPYTPIKWVQIGKAGKLYIWPNPANDVLHVKVPFDRGSIDVVDPGGKLLQKLSITALVTDVPVYSLPRGIYFIRIRNENESLVEKFVKE